MVEVVGEDEDTETRLLRLSFEQGFVLDSDEEEQQELVEEEGLGGKD